MGNHSVQTNEGIAPKMKARRPRGVRGLVEAARTDRGLIERLFRENCALRRENARLARYEALACQDALTGLGNRRHFDERLASELARATRSYAPLSLLFIDLDRFKALNDGAGHVAGDEALAWVGRFLGSTIRTSDVACRTGGDEFGILLPDTDADGATLMADRLRVALEGACDAPHLPDGTRIDLSIGTATAPEDGTTPDALLARADVRMFDDKANRDAA